LRQTAQISIVLALFFVLGLDFFCVIADLSELFLEVGLEFGLLYIDYGEEKIISN